MTLVVELHYRPSIENTIALRELMGDRPYTLAAAITMVIRRYEFPDAFVLPNLCGHDGIQAHAWHEVAR